MSEPVRFADELPPLPTPEAWRTRVGPWGDHSTDYAYTADQMHAYAAQAVAERDAEIAAEQRRSEMYTDLVRRTAEALGQPLWDGWHKLPERVEALRAQLQTDRDYRGQCQAQAADESARRRAAEAEVERLRRDCAEAYQVLGAISTQPPTHTDDDVARALDNMHAAAAGEPRPHDDLLPWPKGVA